VLTLALVTAAGPVAVAGPATGAAGGHGAAATGANAGPAGAGAGRSHRPAAAVALGDSVVSGEGAGDYEDGTDAFGRFCHRSANAAIRVADLPGEVRPVNLACSGATTANVRLGGRPRHGEPPQAEQLRTVARAFDVELVVLTVGTNDLPFALMVVDCVLAYAGVAPACRHTWERRLPGRLAAMRPRVVQALSDVRTVMREAGYRDRDYQLVLQSYPSPFPRELRYPWAARPLHGCPFLAPDLAWARDAGIPRTNQTLRQAAGAVPGVRFLDVTAALDGHQLCAPGIGPADEWVQGLAVDAVQLPNGPGLNLVQHSLHPNRLGQQRLADCLAGFARLPAAAARCVPGPGAGPRLHPDPA
jgi:lysophospholipase L1-like esterase